MKLIYAIGALVKRLYIRFINWLAFHYMRRKLENYPALTDNEISTLRNTLAGMQ